MDTRSASPEIDVVGDGHARRLLQKRERSNVSSENSTNLRAANKNGANLRLAANTNFEAKKNSETVKLRVRPMGIIKVKKEPDADDNVEGSFSISSLLNDCGFETSENNIGRSKSPTLSGVGTPTSTSTAISKGTGSTLGRPRQSLENVISSLKSAKARNDSSISVSPVSIVSKGNSSVTQTLPKTSISVSGSGPQIVDVRSLASVVQSPVSKASVLATMQQSIVSNLSTSAAPTAAGATSGPKPLNIRFVLPASVPFNTDQFQKVLQAALASLSNQSVAVEPDQLQKAIQMALTCVTKSTVAFNPEQLKHAIQNTLALGVVPVSSSQAPQTSVCPPATVAHLKSVKRQPQAIAPKPYIPPPPVQWKEMPVHSLSTGSSVPVSGSLNQSLPYSPALPSSPVVTTTETKALDSRPIIIAVDGRDKSHSSSISSTASDLTSVKDQLGKALQPNCAVDVPGPSNSTPTTIPSQRNPSPVHGPAEANFDSREHDPVSTSPQPAHSFHAGMAASSKAPVCSNSSSTSAVVTLSESPVAKDVSSITFGQDPKSQTGPLQNAQVSGSSLSESIPQLSVSTVTKVGSVFQAGKCTPSVIPSALQVKELSKSPLTAGPQIYVSRQPVQSQLIPTNASNINLQISVPSLQVKSSPVIFSNNKGTSAPQNQLPPSGCGCCSKCTSDPESNFQYTCPYKGCSFECKREKGLEKHYNLYPNHRPRLAIEKASHSVDYFLPEDLLEANRSARLRELFKRLRPEEVKEFVLPRLAKTVSLFQLLEAKSMRSHTISGVPDVSAFKMFSEFERFRKEVEKKLLALILLPQGKGRGRNSKTGDEAEAAGNTGSLVDFTKEKVARVSPVLIKDKETEHIAENNEKASASSSAIPEMSVGSSAEKEAQMTLCSEETTQDSSEQPPNNAKQPGSWLQSPVEEKREKLCAMAKAFEGEPINDSTASSSSEPVVKDCAPLPMKTSVPQKEDTSEAVPRTVLDASADVKMVDSDEGETNSSEQKEEASLNEKIVIDDDSVEPIDVSVNETSSTIIVRKDEELQTNSGGGPSEAIKESKGDAKKSLSKIEMDRSPKVNEQQPTSDVKANEGDQSSSDTGFKESSPEELEKEESVGIEKDKVVKKPHSFNEHLMKETKSVDTEGNNGDMKTEKGGRPGEKIPEQLDCSMKQDKEEEQSVRSDNERSFQDKSKNQPASIDMKEGKRDGKSSTDADATMPSGIQSTVCVVENKGEFDVGKEESSEREKNEDSKTIKVAEEIIVNRNESDPQTDSGDDRAGDVAEKVVSEVKSGTNGSEQNAIHAMQLDEDGDAQDENSIGNEGEHFKGMDSDEGDMTVANKETQTDLSDLRQELSKLLSEITIEDEEDMDESSLLNFGLPFALKWGKIVKSVRHLEYKRVARKDNYSEQEMKHFIYGKPKEAANAVVSADCFAHPSFFRAYVMPALLDKHIDDFGLFGKKLLSRLKLTRATYVDILRTSIGPEFAKIMGINIFPTYKRIIDTYQAVKMMTPEAKVKRNLVLEILPRDEGEASDDEDGSSVASSSSSKISDSSAFRGQNCAESPTAQTVTNCTQNATSKGNDELKRSGQDHSGDFNKKARLDDTAIDVQKDSNETNQTLTTRSSAGVTRSNVKGSRNLQTADQGRGCSRRDAANDKNQPAGSSMNQTSQTDSAVSKSVTEDELKESSSPASQSKSSANSARTSSKAPSTANSTSLIPRKATILTSGGKAGASSLLFSCGKSSPLYLVPVEKLPPKLLEQFINQGKGDGVKTRSTSSPKKGNQVKPSSQVLVLIPSSKGNETPTIQTLSSQEQLKNDGGKKPMLLLPADKVPKSLASLAPSARRKMMITMGTPSSNSATVSAHAQNKTTTSSSSFGDQKSGVSSSVTQASRGPIMSAKENNSCTSEGKDSSVASSSTHSKSVLKHASPLNTPLEVRKLETSKAESRPKTTGADKAISTGVKETGVESTVNSTSSSESIASSSSDGKESTSPSEQTQTGNSSSNADDFCSRVNSRELELLPSLLPSDVTLDTLLNDITGGAPTSVSNDMMPIDVSEIIQSLEDLPNEPASNSQTADLSRDTVAIASESARGDSVIDTGSERPQSASADGDSNSRSRRQSPRKLPSSSLPTPAASLTEDCPQTSSGGLDDEDGSPPRKRRRAPARAAAESSPFVSDKGSPGKWPQGSLSNIKARK